MLVKFIELTELEPIMYLKIKVKIETIVMNGEKKAY